MAQRIVLLGGPGAGKGTQAKRIAEGGALSHISTGEIFRAHAEQKTELGQELQKYMSKGQLVPDELVCEIVAGRLCEADCRDGYILDGFPRSLPQAEELDRLLEERGESITIAVDLEVPDDEIVDRLSARRTCPNCGRIYNLKFDPPAQDGRCGEAACGGAELAHREDDREETIRERLKVYHEITEPIISFYAEKGLLKSVEAANQSPDDIALKIEEILSSAKAT